MNTGAQMLKRGYMSDPEDSRRTARLQNARLILSDQAITASVNHSDRMVAGTALYGEKHECDSRCETTWTTNPSDAVFEAAYALADALASRPGITHPS
jgi:hypothetical protein